jgi:predicted pyridoxine 5'-phosphate oxidase superfamily flavin-nucleotide-binding protein
MGDVSLRRLHACFEGAVPAVIATASAEGTPNVTYLSKVRFVDDERVALSNQFFSKTVRNLAENPRGSLLLVDPHTYDEWRLTLVYERTEKRGAIFEQLREDVAVAAEFHHMEGVFRLRGADVYRVVDMELVRDAWEEERPYASSERLGELIARLSRCTDLDTIVGATVDGLSDVLGYEHSLLMLLDEDGRRLYTMASRGFTDEGVGSEVVVGEGIIGMAAARATPMRIGNLRQMTKYGNTVRRSFEDSGDVGPGHEVPLPGLDEPQSRVAVPMLALGQMVGVLVCESTESAAFVEADEATLTVVATVVANAIEVERARETSEGATSVPRSPAPPTNASTPQTRVRFFAVDGSTFLDGDYLIKGVAGRILWSLLGHYSREQRVEFTNKEVRLDPSLELPEFRDNLDSRLILLKRRLDERAAPMRIEKTGRGRFRINVDTALHLEEVAAP